MMPYKNLYEYLDAVFAEVTNPSDEAVAKAKKDYWKLYRHHYQKNRRAQIKEFTLGFDREVLVQIDRKRQNLSVSEFLYQCIYQVLEAPQSIVDIKILGVIKQQQLQIIMQLETILKQESTIVTEAILERMETLEITMQNLYS